MKRQSPVTRETPMERAKKKNPEVRTNKSGVEYVKAAEVLRSDTGRAHLRKTAEHRAMYQRRDRAAHPTAVAGD